MPYLLRFCNYNSYLHPNLNGPCHYSIPVCIIRSDHSQKPTIALVSIAKVLDSNVMLIESPVSKKYVLANKDISHERKNGLLEYVSFTTQTMESLSNNTLDDLLTITKYHGEESCLLIK